MFCRSCGSRIKMDSTFCSKCGSQVSPNIAPAAPAPAFAGAPLRHSGLGIASTVIAAVTIIYFLVVIVGSIVIADNRVADYSFVVVLGLLIILGGLANLTGLGLGIGAVAQKNRKKVMAILGLVLNAVLLTGLIAMETIGHLRQ